ncbi:MAG TPA: NADH-quinone oxidoreductase subunit N [Acidimicrobiaceae bacterium]|jgi:NADH-quinone oxidoreductase subunit N|nr:NADH-quinone oxidoreductase subunit N [Acidimicrobiaceae bacterium]
MILQVLAQIPTDGVTAPLVEESTSRLVTPRIPWSYLTPQLILFLGAVIGVALVALLPKRLPKYLSALATVVLAAGTLVSIVPLWGRVGNAREGAISAWSGAIGVDRFGLFVTALICLAVLVTALFADSYLRREGLDGPEFYLLLMTAAFGASIMAISNDLIVLFVGVEILSISSYVLTAMHARRVTSQEAGLKYLVLGGFASAVLLYGLALIYGATGSTNLLQIQVFLSERVLTSDGLLLGGLGLMMAGFGFKVGAAPFHMWTPDVYQGAPTPVSGFMASAVKTAAFAGMIRVFVVGFGSAAELWRPIVFVMAVLSLLVGSIVSVVQSNVKRMLAYSSIAHAGFILLGVHSATERGTSAALFYLASYTAMALGSFGIVALAARRGEHLQKLSDLRGFATAHPGLALAFALLLFAQSGVPLTGGFIAKLGVIGAAVDQGDWALAVVAMITAVISTFMYLRIIVSMFFVGGGDHGEEPAGFEGPPVNVSWTSMVGLGIVVVATLFLGILPGTVKHWSNQAVVEMVRDSGR